MELYEFTLSKPTESLLWRISLEPTGMADWKREYWNSLGERTQKILLPRVGFYARPHRGCSTTLVATGDFPTPIAERVLKRIGVPRFTDVASFHVRRTDVKSKCDTSLPAVETYLRCSNLESLPQRDLIFFTDELDPSYVSGVLALLYNFTNANGRPFRIHNGGSLIHREIDIVHGDYDNYLVYAAAALIIGDAGASFAMEKCNHVAPCGQYRVCHPCSTEGFMHTLGVDFIKGIDF